MRYDHGTHSDQSDYEDTKPFNFGLAVAKNPDGQVRGGRWRPMMSRHGNNSDQSDYKDRKTPNFDLAMSKNPDGLIEGISVMMNLIRQISRIGKHLI